MLHSRPGRSPLASPLSRRQALQTASAGFGYLALAGMLDQLTPPAGAASIDKSTGPAPLAPKPPHFRTPVKRIIFLFMQGACHQWTRGTTNRGSNKMTAKSVPAAEH